MQAYLVLITQGNKFKYADVFSLTTKVYLLFLY